MELTILVDDREKKPLEFDHIGWVSSRTARLEYADYTIEGREEVFGIERKTLDDLANCCGVDRERFEHQVDRALSTLDQYGVIVPTSWNDIYLYRNRDSCPNYYSNISPKSIYATIKGWEKSKGLRFLFSGSRSQASIDVADSLRTWETNHVLTL